MPDAKLYMKIKPKHNIIVRVDIRLTALNIYPDTQAQRAAEETNLIRKLATYLAQKYKLSLTAYDVKMHQSLRYEE